MQIIASLLSVASQPVAPEACIVQSRTLALFEEDHARNSMTSAPPIWLVGSRHSASVDSETPSPPFSGSVELWRAEDGLFYVSGLVNGQSIRFLVDTGASMIVLTPDDARRVGAAQADNDAIVTETANGTSRMTRVTLASMQIGGTGAAAVPAAVAQEGLKVSLLGQN